MKNSYLFALLSTAGALALLSARADLEPYSCSHAEKTIAVDLSAGAVRTPSAATDIFPFAYNNTVDWTAGGDPEADAATLEVAQMTGDPSDPASWRPVEGKTKELMTFPGEASVVWLPSGQFLYRAKMTVGETATYAYFDLRGTTDIKPPMTDMTVDLSATELDYTMDPVRPAITVKTESGVTLAEGTDYTLTYSDDVNVGTCLVKIAGIGAYAGETFASYTIVYPAVSTSDPVACRGRDSSGTSPHRVFTRSYVTLTSDGKPTPLANWPLQESAPTLHRPYTSGSGASKLMDCLERSHCGKDLSADEKETVALWLDLGVPFCGSYLEGRLWTRAEELRYKHYQDKRLLYAREELEALRRKGNPRHRLGGRDAE